MTPDEPGPSTATASEQRTSYLKKLSRKVMGSSPPIKTFVFMDLETTPFQSKEFFMPSARAHPHEFTHELGRLITSKPPESDVRITEMSFIAVPRATFIKGVDAMQKDVDEKNSVISQRLSCSILSSLVRPEFSDKQWNVYDRLRQRVKELVHSSEDLADANTFETEWQRVRSFLDSLPKPVCLVAHNGLAFDFRILFARLKRFNLLDGGGLPDDVGFIDSMLMTKELDAVYREQFKEEWDRARVKQAVNNEDAGLKYNLPDDADPALADTSIWPVAKSRRIFKLEHFKLSEDGYWRFDKNLSKKSTTNSLANLYNSVIGGNYKAHYALDDSQALLQICLGYGVDFITYCDAKNADFPF